MIIYNCTCLLSGTESVTMVTNELSLKFTCTGFSLTASLLFLCSGGTHLLSLPLALAHLLNHTLATSHIIKFHRFINTRNEAVVSNSLSIGTFIF